MIDTQIIFRVQIIYNPSYNTGNDFVYNDDFAESADEYLDRSGQYDEEGNRLVQNTESNGRFHTDWLRTCLHKLKSMQQGLQIGNNTNIFGYEK